MSVGRSNDFLLNQSQVEICLPVLIQVLAAVSAAIAILSLNGRHLFGQPIKVNWAYASGQREDTSGHFNIFVGDLSPEVTDATLFACFSVYPSCSDARVMWDQKTGRSRGFGFVSFRNQQLMLYLELQEEY
ncbi:hypothetical protein RIF29_34965 [Crotalaria pallida]|uniref:RRM domain-containing protein n=1 Tax=Crotalaria pallida TaxID=3830 RepID=A0AAN9HXP3_CROPI